MTIFRRVPFLALATVLAMTALVVLIVGVWLKPPTSDLLSLVMFLIATGGGTVLLGLVFPYMPLPRKLTGFRARLVLISAITATLALANVGVTASLMFLSFHDLILLLGLLVFSVGIAAFVALILAEPTIQSVRELLAAAKRMSGGDLDIRVMARSRDEVGEIGEAFNEMAHRLEEGQSRQRELERARRDLVTAVSHDLRTPLASVRAMVESMSDGVVADPDTVKRYLRTTLSEVDSLSQLVDDLFELSQIDAGMLQLHIEAALIDAASSRTPLRACAPRRPPATSSSAAMSKANRYRCSWTPAGCSVSSTTWSRTPLDTHLVTAPYLCALATRGRMLKWRSPTQARVFLTRTYRMSSSAPTGPTGRGRGDPEAPDWA
jgi:signal transduction histidine kinase